MSHSEQSSGRRVHVVEISDAERRSLKRAVFVRFAALIPLAAVTGQVLAVRSLIEVGAIG